MERIRRRMENNYPFDNGNQDDDYTKAYKRVKRIKGFYVHLLVYVLVNLLIIGRRYCDRGENTFTDWDTYSTLIFWGIGIIAHASSVFGRDLFFGDNWEKRKIKELMDKEKGKENKWE